MNKFGALTTIELLTEEQSDKHNNLRNELKHEETHEYIQLRLFVL